jgi:HEAT repeat protein
MLWFVWTLSILLAATSLLVMLALIFRRMLLQRRTRRYGEARRLLHTALISFSEDNNAKALEDVLRAVPARIATDAGFEFLGLLRGEEHARIIDMFAASGLPMHIIGQLCNGNEAARLHAAEMLAAFPSEDATARLLAALDGDRSPEVRIAAAMSLSDLGFLPPLQEMLRRIGPGAQRSRRLVELFRRFPADRLGELEELARSSQAPAVRAAAVDALSAAGDYRLAEFFRTLAKDASVDVSAAAIRALGRLGHPDAEAVITEAIGNGNWEVRAAAADAAGRIGAAQLVEPMAPLLDDEVWTVRYAAAKAMRLIVPAGEEMLRHIASNQASRSQRTASLVLDEGIAP